MATATLRAYFSEARRLSGDYETVFAWDRASEYALSADAVVAGEFLVEAFTESFAVSERAGHGN